MYGGRDPYVAVLAAHSSVRWLPLARGKESSTPEEALGELLEVLVLMATDDPSPVGAMRTATLAPWPYGPPRR